MLIGFALAIWAAVAMTFGDWLWAALSLRHRMIYGLAHGTLLCAWIGVFLGARAGRVVEGIVAGAAVGFAAAGSYYLLAPLVGYAAMFLAWMLLWFGIAAMPSWLARRAVFTRAWGARTLISAIGSALAFYLVSGIWSGRNPDPNYAWHFAAWTLAFLPGFVAILARQPQR